VYAKFARGSNRSGLGDPAFATLLRGRWNEVVTEQMGADGLVAIKPDRPITLLKLGLPKDLQERARTALPPDQQEELVPVFYEVRLGPPQSESNP
jgi:hypothetical protein